MNEMQTLKCGYSAGSQMWFSKKKKYGKNRRIHDFGCGVVALTDLGIYLGMEPLPKDRQEYMRMVCRMERRWIHILPGFGISPYIYPLFANRYFRKKQVSYRIRPMRITGKKEEKLVKIQKMIRAQLKQDLPLIFAAGPTIPVIGRKKRIPLYYQKGDLIVPSGHSVKSHYMTITGIVRIQEQDCYIKLASWGEFWYMKLTDYLEYGKYTLPFTNVVYTTGEY